MSSMYEGIWESSLACKTKALLHILAKMSGNFGSEPDYDTEFLFEPSPDYLAWLLCEDRNWVIKELDRLKDLGIYEVGLNNDYMGAAYPDQVICKVRFENLPERADFDGIHSKRPVVFDPKGGRVTR